MAASEGGSTSASQGLRDTSEMAEYFPPTAVGFDSLVRLDANESNLRLKEEPSEENDIEMSVPDQNEEKVNISLDGEIARRWRHLQRLAGYEHAEMEFLLWLLNVAEQMISCPNEEKGVVVSCLGRVLETEPSGWAQVGYASTTTSWKLNMGAGRAATSEPQLIPPYCTEESSLKMTATSTDTHSGRGASTHRTPSMKTEPGYSRIRCNRSKKKGSACMRSRARVKKAGNGVKGGGLGPAVHGGGGVAGGGPEGVCEGGFTDTLTVQAADGGQHSPLSLSAGGSYTHQPSLDSPSVTPSHSVLAEDGVSAGTQKNPFMESSSDRPQRSCRRNKAPNVYITEHGDSSGEEEPRRITLKTRVDDEGDDDPNRGWGDGSQEENMPKSHSSQDSELVQEASLPPDDKDFGRNKRKDGNDSGNSSSSEKMVKRDAEADCKKRGQRRRFRAGRKRRFNRKLCDICGAKFDDPYHMKLHMHKTHGAEKPTKDFVCEVCGMTFGTKGSLTKHSQFKHIEGNTVECPLCQKVLKCRLYLARHMDIVHSTTKLCCDICGLLVKCKRYLAIHKRKAHMPKSTYACEWPSCGKTFNRRDNLNIHMHIHTNEKPLACEHCEYRCRQRNAMNWHMKKNHLDSMAAGGTKNSVTAQ